MERPNRCSYVKVMAILRTDSELEDKMVRKWGNFVAVAWNWWKQWGNTHDVDSNMTWPTTRPRPGHKLNTTDSTEICKGWTYGTNTRTLETKGRCEHNGIPEALITTWWEQGSPDLPKGSGNFRFGGNETQIDPASKQHDLKPSNNYYFLIFSFT